MTYVAGLYNKINGTLVEGTETTEAELANGTYSVDSVAKGLYTFKVTITAEDGTGPWYYSDDIYIEGNRITSKEINLPKIIREAPAAPLNLVSEFGEKNANLGCYTAKFSWTRDSYNESGFELQIVELDEIPASIDNTLFDESNIFTVENFAPTEYPIYAKDGTLLAGSQAINYDLETGKIYVDTTTNKTYRWGGSSYVEISASLALGETSTSAYRGDRGKTAYDHSQITTGNPHNVTKANVGLGNVENKSSATIRGEITKANVTNALGFTPFEFVVVETW